MEPKRTETTITFVVQKHNNVNSTPRWREVAVENATCPKCKQTLVVMVGGSLYAYCPRCQTYYLAD